MFACRIDFFSLDVEGAELTVLQTLNFSRVDIRVMVIEQDGSSPTKDKGMLIPLGGVGKVAV